MKKVMFLLTVIIVLVSCTKDDDIITNKTYCYRCRITQTITSDPISCGFPKVSEIYFIVCGVTISNAEKFQREQTNFSTLNTNSRIITIENVCTLSKDE